MIECFAGSLDIFFMLYNEIVCTKPIYEIVKSVNKVSDFYFIVLILV